MKTIEEKAKAYDEAYKVAEGIHRFSSNPAEIKRMEEIFPELAENEDERIRKSIIELLNEVHSTFKYYDIKKMLSWLEKQGQKDSQVKLPTFTFDDILALQCCMETVKKVQEDKDLYEKLNDLHGRVYDAYHLEKQGEQKQDPCEHCKDRCPNCHNFPCIEKREFKQGKTALEAIKEEKVDNANKVEPKDYSSIDPHFFKPADMVEPKFHAGDYVVDNCGYVCRIEGVTNRFYILEGIDGCESRPTIEWVNKTFHLWDITKDARDGNVLCTYECGKPKNVFILKGTPKKHCALSYYCYYNIMYPHFDSDSVKGCLAPNDEDVKPATKEQRDTLMKAMSDAGYTFDFEKKELKKIEQKPAWSEEDDFILKDAITAVDLMLNSKFQASNPNLYKAFEVAKHWLKSLKGRIQFKQEWGEEDREMARFIGNAITTDESSDYLKQKNIEVIDAHVWLDSLKERVQPKQEWSEEDEAMHTRCIGILGKCYMGELPTKVEEELNWLKSLSPRNVWKPSDEHYELKEFAKIVRGNLTGISKDVQKLFEDKYLQLTGNKMYGGFKD